MPWYPHWSLLLSDVVRYSPSVPRSSCRISHQQTVPALFFHGADMIEDTKDGLVFLMSGHADRISNDHKRFLTALSHATWDLKHIPLNDQYDHILHHITTHNLRTYHALAKVDLMDQLIFGTKATRFKPPRSWARSTGWGISPSRPSSWAAKVKAKEVCQTLHLQRSQLLGLLSVLDWHKMREN